MPETRRGCAQGAVVEMDRTIRMTFRQTNMSRVRNVQIGVYSQTRGLLSILILERFTCAV